MQVDAQTDDTTWQKQGTFRAADGREFKMGTLGACTYLLSEKGARLTDGFHSFEPIRNFESNGKTYILGQAGACKDILEVAPDGSITNISELIEGPDSDAQEERTGPPGRFHEVFVFDGQLCGELGTGEYVITPGTWQVREADARPSPTQHTRADGKPWWFWLAVIAITAILVKIFGG
ncbi:MAG: hypothetical protein WA021_02830 [Minisyncoccia bacterium]